MCEELKPVRCGCGGEAEVLKFNNDSWLVMCNKCRTSSENYTSRDKAITAWNTAMGAKDINVPTKERNKGKWQRRKGEDCWECSECHAVLENSDVGNHNFYYCYHCGADMMDICGYMDLEKANYE